MYLVKISTEDNLMNQNTNNLRFSFVLSSSVKAELLYSIVGRQSPGFRSENN